MATSSDLPQLKEELERKVFETLSWLIHGVTAAKLTEQQFSTAVDAIFMSVAGLVEHGFIEIVTEAQNQVSESEPASVRKHFMRGNDVVVLQWIVDTCVVRGTLWRSGKQIKTKVMERDTPVDALSSLKRASEALVRDGYAEL